ncbi:putative Centromere protein F-like 2 [Homarus americanus]|uniref:Putative Centromere protein F-like 2 n=1 Tax=Homarus americanus TaxID=6706 RepID=A0A8J5JXY4_HOMAM|nr:putative Centromere protein F-like 2 [Homarus americanus]
MQVKAAESESNSLCKELREVKQQTDHWQKRFSEKNTEAEEQAAKQIELMKKMLDLEEENDNMKSKVLLLQGRIKRLKSEKNGKEAPDGRADKELRNQNVKSDASSSSANNPQKEATNSLGLQGSDSQEIVESSLTQVSRNSTVSQITRRAVTRRASTLLSVPTAPKESSTKISSKSPKEKSTKPQRSSAVSMDEYSTHNSSQSDRLRTLRTRGRSTSTVTLLGDETMKQAIKRVSSSTSVTKDKKKRLNDLSSGVESPGVLQRSTTLAKKMNPKEMLQESGPLRSLNPNSPVRPSTRRAPTHRTSSVGTRTRASSSTARGDDCKVQ